MKHRTIEFTTDKRFVRRARALRTIHAMMRLYCRGLRHERHDDLCPDCDQLFAYARRRLERCVFGDAKPNCANCTVHCYSANERERIRTVMRWAGPRMLLHHPVLAITHMIDEHRPSPLLRAKPARKLNSDTDP